MDRERVARPPFGRSANRADQFDQRFGVANARDVFQRHRMFGEQSGGDDRQGRVLVAGRLDRARQPLTALNDVLNGRHGSTTSPISLVKISSASSTSLTFTCKSERSLVSSVVSQSWPGFISPRPL